MFSFSITSEGLFFYINSNPPDIYLNFVWGYNVTYSQFQNQSFYICEFEFDNPSDSVSFGLPISKYMKLRPDGHLKVYDEYWIEALDFFPGGIGFLVILRFAAIIVFVQMGSVVVRYP